MFDSRNFLTAALSMLVALGVGNVAAATPSESTENVDRLAKALVQILPLGRVFDLAAGKDPKWPVQSHPDALSETQLACVRGELSEAGYYRVRHAEAEHYVAEHQSRIAGDLKVLESGSAELFGKLVMVGAEAKMAGKEPDPNAALAGATNDQVLSMMTLLQDPDFAELRKLSGLGDSLGKSETAAEGQDAGEQLGRSVATRYIIKAMGTCQVPPSAYL